VVEASTNYAVAAAPTAVRRTDAGRATGEALARGEGHALPLDAPATAPVADEGRSLPLLPTPS
jgi:tRNA-2-methylthio-N6-dimethylallyladenosine synthase